IPHLVSWVQDLSLIALVIAGGSLAALIMPLSCVGLVAAVSRGALIILGATLALYPGMLQSSLAFPVNMFNTDIDTATVFLREYAGIGMLWPAAIALCAGIAAPRLTFLRLPLKRTLVTTLFILTLATLFGEAPNPIVFSIKDKFRELAHGGARAVPRLIPGASTGLSAFTTISPLESDRSPEYDHIALVVLEGVTAARFESEFLNKPGGFSERNAKHARYFRNYWTTNLDSYTSLIAMTTSLQVPFRSYADPSRYERVNALPNAPGALRKKQYRTLFISTYEYQPFVPNRQQWDRIADRRDLSDLNGWTSLGTSRMESATEDRAALPLILKHMASAPRTFVLSELVYGHTPEWMASTGLTQLSYYDNYLTELLNGLAKAGLKNKTLTIVVSDHGERSAASDPENYRVPLLIIGKGVPAGEDTEIRSHLDLQGIMAHYIFRVPLPAKRSSLTTVGSTERWVYGEIVPPDQYVFIDDRTGQVLNKGGRLEPGGVNRRFQELVNLIDGTKGYGAAAVHKEIPRKH
ncbi:MAG: sulfatase-like hydrolase/transferase, partial [Elusimicrobiota bacterium]